MHTRSSVEEILQATIDRAGAKPCPPGLSNAMSHAVFPGGSRLRPRLCQAVAAACGEDSGLACVAAASIELLHCASLVHDDMSCFDNATLRRGRASVQAQFGEQLALLTGDALIVLALELLPRYLKDDPLLAAELTMTLANGVAAPCGIAAGQAWECESEVDLSAYHRAKTGALFAAATTAGAVSARMKNPDAWAELGFNLGEAYQVGDDILDAVGREEDIGKPVGQDQRLDRPNCMTALGLAGAIGKLNSLVATAIESIPACRGRAQLCKLIQKETDRILPQHIAALAA